MFPFANSAILGLTSCVAVLFAITGCDSQPTGSAEPTSTTPVPRVWLPLDEFYTPPASVPAVPGVLVRSERLTDRVLPPGSRAWRVMYTTTLPDGSPATAVATVLAPEQPPSGPRPVIMWEHGTAGIEQKCMPSTVTSPFEGIPALEAVINNGWVIVATDYAPNGEGIHPYINGDGETRGGVDSVRAARQMPELTLDQRTVVWGHSQGGHAALSTGIYGPRYAPDVNLVGIAAMAPASNMERIMVMHGGDAAGVRLGAYLATAYSQYYPDVKFDDVVPPAEREIARQLADLCQFDPKDILTLQALTNRLDGRPVIADPSAGAMGERLRENAPNQRIDLPVLVVQGLADAVIDPTVNDTYVDQRCAAGQSLDYWRVPERDHGEIVAPDSPITDPLIAWTQDRLAGRIQVGCQRATIGG